MKSKKQFPMDGPPRIVQQMLLSAAKHREELKLWLKQNPKMREETRACIQWALRN